MKSLDAQTLGGLPASAFVLAAPPNSSALAASATAAAPSASSPSAPPPTAFNVTTTGGTTSTIPMFTTATNIQNSIMTQTGTSSINVLGALNLPAVGTATASKGFNSRPQDFVASVFNGTAAIPQTFQWQAEAVNNDKATTTGTLNLLYASGTPTPAETGLKANNKRQFFFLPGTTYPEPCT